MKSDWRIILVTAARRSDGAPFEDLGPPFEGLVSIGWIADYGGVSDYARGKVNLACLDRLRDDLPSSQPFELQAKFYCHLCTHAPVETCFTSQLGSSLQSYWVPAETGVFIAPGNLVHLIYDHDYQPSQVFVEAVLASPRVGSLAFADGLRPAIGEEIYAGLVREWEERQKQPATDAGKAARCRYCDTRLPTEKARQCLCCGIDWHDETRVSIAKRPVEDPRVLSLFERPH